MRTKFKDFLQTLTLKTRISLVFGLSTFVLLMFTVIISYVSMKNIITEKLHTTYESNLKQIMISFENRIADMNYVSQQISFSPTIRNNLLFYLEKESPFERLRHYGELKNELNNITLSNPNIGLSLLYIESENQMLFNSQGTREDFNILPEPVLIEGYKLNNYGPHISQERYKDETYVLSTVRELDIHYQDNIYIYLESNTDFTQNLIEVEHSLNNTNYMIVNQEQKIIYSEIDAFHKNERFPLNQESFGKTEGYYWFSEPSKMGWNLIALVPIEEYDAAMNQWSLLMRYIVLLFVFISIFASLLLWRSFHKPLNEFRSEIRLMAKSDFQSEIIETKIPEFVELTNQFREMKSQIVKLIEDIELKERERSNLEIDKLMHQINPHFLMNTLDTAKWLAMSGDKQELSQLLTSLNKILYYNMGKLGQASSLREEIDSMEQYLKLQQIRYDFDYILHLDVPETVLSTSMPRFILQPLVENSIYHGLVDEGKISVEVKLDYKHIVINVIDNGRGMLPEKVNSILIDGSYDESKIGLGIGLNYVKRILTHTYGDLASIEVESEVNVGTAVILRIPL